VASPAAQLKDQEDPDQVLARTIGREYQSDTVAPAKQGYGNSDRSVDLANQNDPSVAASTRADASARLAGKTVPYGTFGSGWTGGLPSKNPALDSLRTPPPPVTAPVVPASGSLAGGYGNNTRVGPVPGAPVSANPNPGAEKVLSGIPPAPGGDVTVAKATPGQQPAGLLGATDLSAPAAPTPAEAAGAKVRAAIGGAVGTGVGALKTAAGKVGDFFSRSSPPPAAGIGGERVDIPAGGENALAPIAGFARGLTGTGRASASGVSNAQAARIQQPTAANPVPVTDTTPDQHPDESENAITRFGRLPTGLFDNPNTRRKFGYKKTAFAGF
jgi:hypothetical protein